MIQNKLQVWAGHCLAQKKRLGTLALGFLGNWLILTIFDFVLYPYTLYVFGVVQGWIIMMFASLLTSLLTIEFYDWAKKDWVGIEAIKSLRDEEAISKLGKFTSWALKKSDPVVLIFLSVKFEPVITTLYMRSGSNKFDGFTSRDWRNFFLSTLIANFYWGMIVLTGIDVIEWIAG